LPNTILTCVTGCAASAFKPVSMVWTGFMVWFMCALVAIVFTSTKSEFS